MSLESPPPEFLLAVEPKGEWRIVEVTARRTKVDFVEFVYRLVKAVYASHEGSLGF